MSSPPPNELSSSRTKNDWLKLISSDMQELMLYFDIGCTYLLTDNTSARTPSTAPSVR